MAEKDPHNDWGLEDLKPFQDAINESIRKMVYLMEPPVDTAILDSFELEPTVLWRDPEPLTEEAVLERLWAENDQRLWWENEIPAEGQE